MKVDEEIEKIIIEAVDEQYIIEVTQKGLYSKHIVSSDKSIREIVDMWLKNELP